MWFEVTIPPKVEMVSKAEIAEFRERLTKLTQSAEVLFDEAESRHFGGKTFSDAWEDLLDDSQRGKALTDGMFPE
jgi:hypothetical protein